MGAMLDALSGLQDIQRGIAAIQSKADAKRRKVRFQMRALRNQEALIEQKEAEIRECQLEIDRLDLDVKTREQDLQKHREALNRTKSNREYATILTAINTEKADSAKLESRQLQLMTELDDRRHEVDQLAAERGQIAQRVEAAERDLQAYLQESDSELKRLQQDRSLAAESLPPTVLAAFERVAHKHEGEALAEVVVLNAKRDEYICSGCNMAVPLEVVLSIRTRDDLQVCPSCGRILHPS